MPYHYRYVYLHGFGSSPRAKKAEHVRRMLSGFGLDLHVPDLNRPSFAELSPNAILRELHRIADAGQGEPLRIIASSLGGLLAALFAAAAPERVDSMVWIAPAFAFGERWAERLGDEAVEAWRERGTHAFPNAEGEPVPVYYAFYEATRALPRAPSVTAPTLILHGRADDVVPIALSREYAATHPNVELLELQADHALTGHEDRVAAETQRFFTLGRTTVQ